MLSKLLDRIWPSRVERRIRAIEAETDRVNARNAVMEQRIERLKAVKEEALNKLAMACKPKAWTEFCPVDLRNNVEHVENFKSAARGANNITYEFLENACKKADCTVPDWWLAMYANCAEVNRPSDGGEGGALFGKAK